MSFLRLCRAYACIYCHFSRLQKGITYFVKFRSLLQNTNYGTVVKCSTYEQREALYYIYGQGVQILQFRRQSKVRVLFKYSKVVLDTSQDSSFMPCTVYTHTDRFFPELHAAHTTLYNCNWCF